MQLLFESYLNPSLISKDKVTEPKLKASVETIETLIFEEIVRLHTLYLQVGDKNQKETIAFAMSQKLNQYPIPLAAEIEFSSMTTKQVFGFKMMDI